MAGVTMTTLERLDALIERGVFYDCDWQTLTRLRKERDELIEALEMCISSMQRGTDEIWAHDHARSILSKIKEQKA